MIQVDTPFCLDSHHAGFSTVNGDDRTVWESSAFTRPRVMPAHSPGSSGPVVPWEIWLFSQKAGELLHETGLAYGPHLPM